MGGALPGSIAPAEQRCHRRYFKLPKISAKIVERTGCAECDRVVSGGSRYVVDDDNDPPVVDDRGAGDKCEQRCQRIHQRSLARVGFDDEKLRKLLEKQRPLGTTKDICWRVFDHLDCMKQCNSSPEHEKFDKFVRSKCRFALRGMHSVRCSTFLKEATELKLKSDPTLTPSQQICRYLHLNTLCLENTVTQYCPSAKKYFRRLNFRDYFPNFILPTNDTVFDDVDLDSCQMFDFVKKNNKFTESQLDKELTTVINFLEAKNVATLPPWTTTRSTISDERKEFTSLLEELLEEPSAVPETPTTALSNTSLTTTTTESTTTSTSSTTLPPTTTSTVPPTTSDTVALMTTSTVQPTSGSSSTTTATTLLPNASPKKGKYPPKSNKALAQKPKTSLKTTTPSPVEQLKTTPSTSVAPDLSIDLSTSPGTTPADEYGGYEYEEGPGNTSVDMVPIEKLTEIDSTDDSATTRKRLFSEDSWEFTPPNFRWSSMRFGNGGVTPLDIDTTTLFGMEEDDSGEDDEELAMEGDPMQPKKEQNKPKLGKFVISAHLSSSERRSEDHLEDGETTARPNKNVTEEAPLEQNLHLPSLSLPEKKPDVPVLRSNRVGAGNEVDNETVPLNPQDNDVQKAEMEILEGTSITPDPEPEELSATKTKDRAFSRLRTSTLRTTSRATMDKPARPTVPVNAKATAAENTTVLPRSVNDRSDRETLVLIYSLLLAVTIFTLMCILICIVWCRKTSAAPVSKPLY
ncbi:unnamed protein product [Nippostrongylus brasiliensis]|uniref:Chondroitin proteoglycan 4 domain-containing protein n=1 Tax=Nippostrongylus brasiliensis TaxID=27835 RepID=A0A0N4Y2S2_NIPBR|nr:unnamed protein product [Nippostrongylus brasiliensis]